jgi:hypothetical protein
LVVTMIGRLISEVGHAIWWYSEEVADGEMMSKDGFHARYLINVHGVETTTANLICAFAITVFSYPAMRFLVI